MTTGSDTRRAHSMPIAQTRRFPWTTLIFLVSIFFLLQHHLDYSEKASVKFLPTGSELVTDVGERSMTHYVIVLSLGIFGILSLIQTRDHVLRMNGVLGGLMLCFAGWAALSPAWAEDPAQVLRRLITFGIVCLAAAAIAHRLTMSELLLLFFCFSLFFLLLGASAEISLGTFQPLTFDYRFAGTQHPNQQGINCAILMLSGVAAADTYKRRRLVFRVCALLGLVFLILTASRTAFFAAVVALGIYAVTAWCKQAKVLVAVGLGVASCVLMLAMSNRGVTDAKSATMLGRGDSDSDSFNGRTGVWDDCLYYAGQHLIVGYGYDGFWTQSHIQDISDAQGWGVAEAHSAYIECLLSLGLVGLITYILVLAVAITRSFRYFRSSENAAFAFSAAFLTFCVIDGLFESAALVSPTLLCFMTAVLITLGFRHDISSCQEVAGL